MLKNSLALKIEGGPVKMASLKKCEIKGVAKKWL